MGVYNGQLKDNAIQYGLQWYVRKNKDNLVEIVDKFGIDKVCMGFRTYNVNDSSGNRIKDEINFYFNIPEFELLCHNILTGNFSARVNRNSYSALYKGSPRDGKYYSRVLSFSKANKGFFLTAHEGIGQKLDDGAVKPLYKLNDNDHIKISVMLTPEELKSFALQGKRALDFYYLHYFGRE